VFTEGSIRKVRSSDIPYMNIKIYDEGAAESNQATHSKPQMKGITE